jgi:hypothetical protein
MQPFQHIVDIHEWSEAPLLGLNEGLIAHGADTSRDKMWYAL